jgi:hypothetical protein
MPEQISKYPDVTLKVLTERCRWRPRSAAENLETMPSGPFLFTTHGGNLCLRHK